VQKTNSGTHDWVIYVSSAVLVFWLLGMIFLVEPSPLQTPESMVGMVQSLLKLSEPQARVFASIILRGFGIGMIGVLLAGVLQAYPLRWAAPAVLLLTPIVAIGIKWIDFGYFPLRLQIYFILASAVLGALLGLSLRRSLVAIAGLVVLVVAILGWGMSTGIGDDLDEAARATGRYLLSHSDQVSSGDEAFTDLLEMAFAFAEDNSHGADPVFTNRAAILALGVVLGDDKIAKIGGREIDPKFKDQREALRRRVTIHGRGDLPRHFCVSAALTVLSGEDRALAVGVAKETADSLPGGSGFSFVDMAANQAGIRFATLATQDFNSARRLQFRLIDKDKNYKFVPEITGLPEGLSEADFQTEYGGVGGSKSRELFNEIAQRINATVGLQ
jgi:hypothetical protein